MIKKRIYLLFAFLLAFSLLTACKKNVGTDEDNAIPASADEVTEDKEYVFGFSCISMDNPYYITLESAVRGVIEDEGATMITKDPASDSDLQIEQIREMIESGIDAIFLSPVDWEAIGPALEELKQAEVKIINVDTHVMSTEYVDAYIGSDNKTAGYLCGENLIERCSDGGKVIILEGLNINSITERITGFEEAIATAENGFTIAVRQDVQGDLEEALAATEEILKNEEDIVAIMCGNDQTALGALVAVNAAGADDILIYGVDGSPDLKKELQTANTSIAGTAAQSPINMGKEAAEIGLAILRDEPFEKETYTDVFFVDKDNVEMYGFDGWQ